MINLIKVEYKIPIIRIIAKALKILYLMQKSSKLKSLALLQALSNIL